MLNGKFTSIYKQTAIARVEILFESIAPMDKRSCKESGGSMTGRKDIVPIITRTAFIYSDFKKYRPVLSVWFCENLYMAGRCF